MARVGVTNMESYIRGVTPGSLISLTKPLEISLLNWPNEKYSAFGIGGWSRRQTRLKSRDRMCHVKARQKHLFFLRPIFDLAPNTCCSSDVHFLLKFFLVFQTYGTFKLFVCFQHKSRSATPDTFRDSAKTFSDTTIYALVSNCVFGQ